MTFAVSGNQVIVFFEVVFTKCSMSSLSSRPASSLRFFVKELAAAVCRFFSSSTRSPAVTSSFVCRISDKPPEAPPVDVSIRLGVVTISTFEDLVRPSAIVVIYQYPRIACMVTLESCRSRIFSVQMLVWFPLTNRRHNSVTRLVYYV